MSSFQPHVTVATIIPNEDQSRFLFVEEISDVGQQVINQPAGHLEANESLIEAAVRETLEETGWHIEVTGFLGIAIYAANNGITYVRNTFVGKPLAEVENAQLDEGIIGPIWLSEAELLTRKADWRSELTYNSLKRYLDGPTFPLSAFYS